MMSEKLMKKVMRAEWAKVFLDLDDDGNGWLSHEEISRWLREDTKYNVDDDLVKEVFEEIDTDEDGKISLDEFYEFMDGLPRSPVMDSAAMLRREFQLLDTNQTGKLTRDQLLIGIKNCGSVVGKGMCKVVCHLVAASVSDEIDIGDFMVGAVEAIVELVAS